MQPVGLGPASGCVPARGASFVAAKDLTFDIGVAPAAALRFVVAAIALGLICAARRERMPRGRGLAVLLGFWAVRRTSATRASILMGTEPVWALIVAVLPGGERVGVVGLLDAALIVAASYAGQAIERRHRLRALDAAISPSADGATLGSVA